MLEGIRKAEKRSQISTLGTMKAFLHVAVGALQKEGGEHPEKVLIRSGYKSSGVFALMKLLGESLEGNAGQSPKKLLIRDC